MVQFMLLFEEHAGNMSTTDTLYYGDYNYMHVTSFALPGSDEIVCTMVTNVRYTPDKLQYKKKLQIRNSSLVPCLELDKAWLQSLTRQPTEMELANHISGDLNNYCTTYVDYNRPKEIPLSAGPKQVNIVKQKKMHFDALKFLEDGASEQPQYEPLFRLFVR